VDWFSVVARLFLAGVFLVAAATKATDRVGVRETLRAFRAPAALIPAGALLLPAVEAIVAAALLIEPAARIGAAGALVLLAIFTAAIAATIRRGEDVECHCFGQASADPVGPRTLLRNGALAAIAIMALATDPPSLTGWLGDRSAAEIVALLLGFTTVVLAALAVRYRARLKPLEFELVRLRRRQSAGLDPGAPVPVVTVERLDDGTKSTTDRAIADRQGVLVFVSSSCPACEELLPHLSRWQRTLAADLPISVIASGDAGELRRQAERHDLRDVLIEEDGIAHRAFRLAVTPAAVAVLGDTIASQTVAGIVEIEALIRRATVAPALVAD
jgi:uncharacterized membrane protein YphA (DoxX/SURF4 family)/thiol-disulfide isomerase/thioredoxin